MSIISSMSQFFGFFTAFKKETGCAYFKYHTMHQNFIILKIVHFPAKFSIPSLFFVVNLLAKYDFYCCTLLVFCFFV